MLGRPRATYCKVCGRTLTGWCKRRGRALCKRCFKVERRKLQRDWASRNPDYYKRYRLAKKRRKIEKYLKEHVAG